MDPRRLRELIEAALFEAMSTYRNCPGPQEDHVRGIVDLLRDAAQGAALLEERVRG